MLKQARSNPLMSKLMEGDLFDAFHSTYQFHVQEEKHVIIANLRLQRLFDESIR